MNELLLQLCKYPEYHFKICFVFLNIFEYFKIKIIVIIEIKKLLK